MEKIIFCLLLCGILLGCSTLNLLPSESRDQWYIDHAEDTRKPNLVEIGMTKEEVLELWGEPRKKITEDFWEYKFPYFANKEYVVFKDGVVEEVRTTKSHPDK